MDYNRQADKLTDRETKIKCSRQTGGLIDKQSSKQAGIHKVEQTDR